MKEKLIFVYGTLKKGYSNHSILGDSEFVGEFETNDDFILFDCGFPYMVVPEELKAENTLVRTCVRGEIYAVSDPDVLDHLDALEGVAYNHYRHQEITVVPVNSEEDVQRAIAYVPCDADSCIGLPLCPIVDGAYQWG